MNLFPRLADLLLANKPPLPKPKPKKPQIKKQVEIKTRIENCNQFLIQPEHLPEFMQVKGFKGVFVGSCISKQDGRWKAKYGEAHCHMAGPWRGYICARNIEKTTKRTTMCHEIAHWLSRKTSKGNGGHTISWAKEYVALVDGRPKWLTVQWLQKKYGFDSQEIGKK